MFLKVSHVKEFDKRKKKPVWFMDQAAWKVPVVVELKLIWIINVNRNPNKKKIFIKVKI